MLWTLKMLNFLWLNFLFGKNVICPFPQWKLTLIARRILVVQRKLVWYQIAVTLAIKLTWLMTPLLSSPRRSVTSAVPARWSSALPGPKWQPASNRSASSRSTDQSTSTIFPPHRPIGTGCTSTTAGDYKELIKFFVVIWVSAQVILSSIMNINIDCFLQVTIQVQEVELGGGAQRQGSFLSTPGGHRVLGKQLSADNAEMHRWPHPSRHHVPWWLPNLPNNTIGLFLCCLLCFIFVLLISMTSPP